MDLKEKMMAAAGATKQDFEATDKMAEIETALIELAEVIDTAITEHENALVEIADMLAEKE